MKKGERVILWILAVGALVLAAFGVYSAVKANRNTTTTTKTSAAAKSGTGDPASGVDTETPGTSKSK